MTSRNIGRIRKLRKITRKFDTDLFRIALEYALTGKRIPKTIPREIHEKVAEYQRESERLAALV